MNKVWIKIISLVAVLLAAAGIVFAIANYTPKRHTAQTPIHQIKEPQPKETRLFFGGDIMLSRNVSGKIVEAQDPTLPFQKIWDVVKNADLAFANLESPFYDKGPRVTQGLVFKAEPNTIEGLKAAGFDVLSTANNHAFDQGEPGIEYTLNWLEQNNITPLGTGLDCHKGVIKEVNDIKFGFLGYSYTALNDGGKSTDPLVCDWNNQKQVDLDIKKLKPQVDFLIISSHMGVEYTRQPTETNAAWARAAIDAGADLFVGHHPHWIQTIEEYQGKYIFYSLGNFVFDQMWSQDTQEGLTFEALFKDKNLSRITLRPVIIEDYCCPRWADETETKSILGKIGLTNPILFDKN